jgi:TPR repeat protein
MTTSFEKKQQSALLGDADSMFELGLCYVKGDGCTLNLAAAVHWYERAAVAGNHQAMVNCGQLLLRGGAGVQPNKFRALEWFRKAEAAGSKSALFEIGQCHAKGWGVEENASVAVEWFKRAAEKGDQRAIDALATFPPTNRRQLTSSRETSAPLSKSDASRETFGATNDYVQVPTFAPASVPDGYGPVPGRLQLSSSRENQET